MKAQAPPKLNRQILDEACVWFVDFRVGDVDERANERFDDWLRRSPEHIRAYMEIAKTYVVLPTLAANRKIDVQELIGYARSDGNVVPFEHAPPNETERVGTSPGRSARHHRPRLFSGPLAAAVVIACLTASIVAWLVALHLPTYATEIGERRSITLADGSTIDLNARSKIRINFSEHERGVELIDGQALFEVAKDKTRPFVVHSGAAVVRAVGTEFDVYRKKSGTTVTVVEGRVTVGHEGSDDLITLPEPPKSPQVPSAVSTFLSAGEQMTVTDRTMAAPKRANVAAATAWVQHRLIFEGSRLSDVVEDFNRYNTRQLIIEDPALQDIRVSGVYSSTDPASLIRFLRAQPGVEVNETEDDVRITRQ